jgi:hypothetical protein
MNGKEMCCKSEEIQEREVLNPKCEDKRALQKESKEVNKKKVFLKWYADAVWQRKAKRRERRGESKLKQRWC